MLNVNIICVGKLKEDYLRAACAEYQKRLGAFCRLNVIELTPARLPENPNDSQIAAALADDLNIAPALAAIFDLMRTINRLADEKLLTAAAAKEVLAAFRAEGS